MGATSADLKFDSKIDISTSTIIVKGSLKQAVNQQWATKWKKD
jgi:hypothetical protein